MTFNWRSFFYKWNMKSSNTKISDAWVLHQIDLWSHTIYNIFTKAKEYRWGKIYTQNKLCTILSGSCELTMLINGIDIKETLLPGTIKTIPAWIPNLFYFPENSEMLERFPKNSSSEKYDRYYSIKNKKT